MKMHPSVKFFVIFFFINYSTFLFSQNYFYSFENSLEGWSKGAADLELNGSSIFWSIETSGEQAADSNFSVKYYIENLNDAGKIWIVKSFPALSSENYSVTIHYKLCTADFGTLNNFRIITGAHSFPPQNGNELTYQEETTNGCGSDCGFIWLDKSYEFIIEPAADSVWIAIGIWGTYETTRSYYLDSLSISFKQITSAEDNKETSLKFNLSQNFPNPFNSFTIIKFSLPQPGFTSLKIFDMLGSEVETLINSHIQKGNYEIPFNASRLSGGIYFYRLNQRDFSETKKMILLR